MARRWTRSRGCAAARARPPNVASPVRSGRSKIGWAMASEPSSELWRRLERAGTAIDPGLSERDVERLVAGARRLVRRRAAGRRALAGAALIVLTGGGMTGAGLWWK